MLLCKPTKPQFCELLCHTKHSVTSWLIPGPAPGLQGPDTSKREGNGKPAAPFTCAQLRAGASPAWCSGEGFPLSLDYCDVPIPRTLCGAAPGQDTVLSFHPSKGDSSLPTWAQTRLLHPWVTLWVFINTPKRAAVAGIHAELPSQAPLSISSLPC